jgi:UDP-N-acetylglucosamine 4-epimerase
MAGSSMKPVHGPERPGDVKHSLADISKARDLLGYEPAVSTEKGLQLTFEWYKNNPGRL